MNNSNRTTKMALFFAFGGILLIVGAFLTIINAMDMNQFGYKWALEYGDETAIMILVLFIVGIVLSVVGIILIILGIVTATKPKTVAAAGPAAVPVSPYVAPTPAPAPIKPVINPYGGGSAVTAIDDVGKTENYGGSKLGPGKINCISGEYAGASFPIHDRELIKFGTDSTKSNIIFSNHTISSLHCAIEYDGNTGNYKVTDFSTNGTYYSNGTRLPKNTCTICPPGTVIYIVSTENMIRLG